MSKQNKQRSGSVAAQKKKSENQSSGSQEKAEEKLQAVVLADSFSKEFRPITLEKPRSLLPLANIPILEYVLELLAGSGIQEIYVFCCHGANQIQEYIRTSKWQNAQSGPIVKAITSNAALSAGDALRTIYTMDLIRDDFVLIAGDVISNLDLKPILLKHKAERKANPQHLMTTVFKKQRPSKLNFLHDRDYIWVAIAPENNQLIYFENEKRDERTKAPKKFTVPLQKFDVHKKIQIRSDLIDCHIDICSYEVLEVFNDNFDFQDLRQDFLKDALTNEEIVQYKVSPYVISNEFAARVSSLKAYENVTKDIVRKWLYPVTLDSNFSGKTTFRHSRPNNYYEDNVSLSRTCSIEEDTVIGSKTTVGENTKIIRSIIGRNVKIGNGVHLEDCFIWDNVVIEDGVKIVKSLVCNGAKIMKGAVLSKGCVISFNVVIGEGNTIPEHTRITRKETDDDDDDEEDDENEDDEEDDENAGDLEQSTPITENLGTTTVGRVYAKTDLENKFNLLGITDDELQEEPIVEEEEIADLPEKTEQQNFNQEVQDTVKRAALENHEIDNALLEIRGLKLSFDMTFMDCAKSSLGGLILCTDNGKRKMVEMLKMFKAILKGDPLEGEKAKRTPWAKLIITCIKDEKRNLTKCQVDLLEYLLEFFKSEGKKFADSIQTIINLLYDIDIISEDAVLLWEKNVKATQSLRDPKDMELLAKCSKFIDWLKTADEESDEDDE